MSQKRFFETLSNVAENQGFKDVGGFIVQKWSDADPLRAVARNLTGKRFINGESDAEVADAIGLDSTFAARVVDAAHTFGSSRYPNIRRRIETAVRLEA